MTHERPVVFGEVLFDCFGEEAKLGGAPFNVAWHLRGFGLDPLFISRIGNDTLGARVAETMQRWGMDLSGLQRDPSRPTGRVRVSIETGQPKYEILPEQAYDSIGAPAARLLDRNDCALLYHGTLALRNNVSRTALHAIRRRARLPVFIDVNLRPPWWSQEQVVELVRDAACIKLNAAELALLTGRDDDPRPLASELKAELNVGALVVTMAEQGAFVLTGEKIYCVEASPAGSIVDTVGAGDAFSAVTIMGLLTDWPWQETMQRAADFAAEVCRYRGALREDHGIYRAARRRWGGMERC